jgi:vesicle transport protein SEC22
MPKLTFIGRVSDGMVLCETYEDLQKENFELKTLAKNTLKKLARAPDACVLETQLNHTFYYKIVDGICYLTCSEAKYPKKLAMAFLEEIITGFQEEMKKTWGSGESVDFRSRIETIERPYFFIKFDRFIKKKRLTYLSPSQDMLEAQKELEDVKNMMRQNINTLLERERTINEIGSMAGKLKTDSELFATKSKKLNFAMWLRKYGLMIAVLLFIIIALYYKFW